MCEQGDESLSDEATSPFVGREGYMAALAADVTAELVRAGRSVPIPPDPDDPDLDNLFWETLVGRLTPAERRWLRA